MVNSAVVNSDEINLGILVWGKVEQMVILIFKYPLKKGIFQTNQNNWLL